MTEIVTRISTCKIASYFRIKKLKWPELDTFVQKLNNHGKVVTKQTKMVNQKLARLWFISAFALQKNLVSFTL